MVGVDDFAVALAIDIFVILPSAVLMVRWLIRRSVAALRMCAAALVKYRRA